MKIYNALATLVLGTLAFSSCDLDTLPAGDIVTESQKEEVMEADPTKLRATANGLKSGLIAYGTISDEANEYHYDFGYAAACLMWEASGQDFVSPYVGYNWFRDNMDFNDRVYTSDINEFLWKLFYNHMKTANDLIVMIPQDTEDEIQKVYLGQALASRAFDNLNLVQMFQFTYEGHESAPAIPIIKAGMSEEEIRNNPRARVDSVYKFIMSDLDNAIDLLDGYERASKDEIDQNVAYGLRARANLIMQNWAEAAEDAEKAMAGYTPYSREAVSDPSFNSIKNTSWIWGNIVTENDEITQTGIVNWCSHLSSFTGNGYSVATRTYRMINQNLWSKIPESDVRKGWWVDEKLESPLLRKAPTYKGKYTDNVTGEVKDTVYTFSQKWGYSKYTNVKFHAYNSDFLNVVNACDWPMMRAEEMLLIKAEGEAMSGNITGAQATLEGFVKTYRDDTYTCTASSQEAIQDEIWFQRRVELWGEGFSFFDLLRLKKPLERLENGKTNYPSACQYNLPAESKIFLWRIPEKEISVNNAISESDNNESVTPPVASAGE